MKSKPVRSLVLVVAAFTAGLIAYPTLTHPAASAREANAACHVVANRPFVKEGRIGASGYTRDCSGIRRVVVSIQSRAGTLHGVSHAFEIGSYPNYVQPYIKCNYSGYYRTKTWASSVGTISTQYYKLSC